VSRLAGAHQGYRYGRTKERSEGPFCGYGPRYTSSWSYLVRLVPLVPQKDEEEVEVDAKPRGVAHTAVNITSLRPQTSVVLHRSSILPVHTSYIYARSVFLSSFLCVNAVFFSRCTRRQVYDSWLECVCARARACVCVCVCVYVCARARVCIPCVNWRGTFFAFYLSVCKLLVKIFFSFYSDTSKSVILACVICKLVWHVFYLCVRSVTHVYALLRSHTDSLTLIWMRNGVAYSFISVAIIWLLIVCVIYVIPIHRVLFFLLWPSRRDAEFLVSYVQMCVCVL